MLYKGHLATTEAIVLSTLVLKEVSLVSMVPPLLFIGLGTMIPDIDHPDSKVGQKFNRIATFIHKKFGHRSITHNVLFILCWLVLSYLSFLFNLKWLSTIFVYLAIGVYLHLLVDAYSISGVNWFYPIFKRNKRRRILKYKSGGLFERIWLFLMMVIIISFSFLWVNYLLQGKVSVI